MTIRHGAAYRALMAGRLIAVDENPEVRPIAMGEVLRRLIAKCLLSVAKGEVQEACGIDSRHRRWCSWHALKMGDTQDGRGMVIPSH